ncbi:flap endonuclease-1 PIN domain protein [Rhizoctonia solani AG-3 Rhs1AP]|uniref:Flap endonuclease-1 PIN domain protein n=2 Tax=Rhizoctonia solani AG-3 TaxID=1086053 RepID=A0A074SDT4_9AGAM|nr:flap endonuclease-1 PIN domain protein [Rhizoctonia solani AG-3 Rhs1AP]KEP55825.1 flap endonuclease-1 PIN domain protein [Rhizoctonia solani 123E]
MGIQGLLPLLKPIHINTNIAEFSRKTLAVDGYVWLHRGAYACAAQLVKGQYTTKYVDYVMHRVRMLRHHSITPYIVFDGGPLPAKRGTEKDREEKRAKNLAQAQILEAQGRGNEAYEFFKKCVDITPQMAYQVIKALRAEGISYVVAPYEADAQLAYLEREGIVDGIITEDSDLVVFGCRNLLFKLGTDGACVNVRRDDLGTVKDLLGWGDKELRWMAMLSGCDYIDSLPGLGLKTAQKLLRKWKTVDKVIQAIRMDGSHKMPKGYPESFGIAELAFLHQRVYDPVSQSLTHLGPPPDDEEWDESKDAFVGEDLPADVAKKIAEGDFCPISRDAMIDIMPTFQPKPRKGKAASNDLLNNSLKASHKSISTYFGAASISSQPKKYTPLPKFVSVKGSGRSSLSAQVINKTPPEEDDWEVMEIEGPIQSKPRPNTASRFFDNQSTPRKSHATSRDMAERKRKRADSLEEITTPRASRTLVRRWSGDLVDITVDEEHSKIAESSNTTSRSASPDTFSLLQDLSSPIQPNRTSRSESPESISGDMSSPISGRRSAPRHPLHLRPSLGCVELEEDLDQDAPTSTRMLAYNELGAPLQGGSSKNASQPSVKSIMVDLQQVFSQESVSEIGTSEEGPWTPSDPPPVERVSINEGTPDLHDAEYISDDDNHEAEIAERQSRVTQGWVAKYGFKIVKGRKSLSALPATQSTEPSSPPRLSASRPVPVFQPLGMPKSRPKARGRKSEPALRTEIVIDDDDEDFLLGSKTEVENDIIVTSSPECAARRFDRFKCPT